jgi:hypothetical protein
MNRFRLGLAALILALAMPMTAVGASAVRCYPIRDFFGVEQSPTVVGDVNGDHKPDTVRTTARWVGEWSCRAWLVVDTGDHRYRRQVESPGILIGPPPVAALVRLGHGPGLAIAIVPWKGAATSFLDLYGIRDHRLVKMNSGLFGYAGSIVNRAGVDCASHRGAALVSSMATYQLTDNRYHVRRLFYRLRAGNLESMPWLTQRVRVHPAGLVRFPELGAYVPFPSCTAVAGLI